MLSADGVQGQTRGQDLSKKRKSLKEHVVQLLVRQGWVEKDKEWNHILRGWWNRIRSTLLDLSGLRGVEPPASDNENLLFILIDVNAVTMRKRKAATQSRHTSSTIFSNESQACTHRQTIGLTNEHRGTHLPPLTLPEDSRWLSLPPFVANLFLQTQTYRS